MVQCLEGPLDQMFGLRSNGSDEGGRTIQDQMGEAGDVRVERVQRI